MVAKPTRTRNNERDVRLVHMINKLHLKLVIIKSQAFCKIREKGFNNNHSSAVHHSAANQSSEQEENKLRKKALQAVQSRLWNTMHKALHKWRILVRLQQYQESQKSILYVEEDFMALEGAGTIFNQ